MSTRRVLFQVGLSIAVVALLALTSPRAGRSQDTRAATDVRVVNPTTAPVYTSIVNPASAPVQAKIVNAIGTPVPANIINPATTPVQAKIVNGPASPVQTSLVGSPVVGAKQSGVWSVTVGNPATAPVRTRDAGDTGLLFGEQRIMTIPENFTNAVAEIPVTAAAGQWLLIEQVNANGFVAPGETITLFEIRTSRSVNGSTVEHTHAFPVQSQGLSAGGSPCFSCAELTRIYHDPTRGPLRIDAVRSGVGANATVLATIHGRFIRP